MTDDALVASARIGTSGFSYKEWKGLFYPEDLAATKFLSYYASRLPAVEIDYTFYRMPNLKTLEGWQDATPESFRFTLKATRKITHFERLKVPSEALEYWTRTTAALGGRLGALLYQLPPNFKCDLDRLRSFLSCLPANQPAAFEFRHDSWFTDDVYALLKQHGAALCIMDDDEHTTPAQVTAGFTYVRLRRSEYSPQQREEWLNRIRSWVESGTDVFAFIKHEDNPRAPVVALEFADEFARTKK